MERINEANELFYKTYMSQAEITELFYQMKVMQIEERYEICVRLQRRQLSREHVPLFLTYT